jgi:hypothetical protein
MAVLTASFGYYLSAFFPLPADVSVYNYIIYTRKKSIFLTRLDFFSGVILTKLFKQQNGICPARGEKLTADTGCKLHNAIVNGKTVKSMVHPACRDVVHSGFYPIKSRNPRRRPQPGR